jgi:hypothetical protein
MPKYIDEILKQINMETPRRVLVPWKGLKQDSSVSQHLVRKNA